MLLKERVIIDDNRLLADVKTRLSMITIDSSHVELANTWLYYKKALRQLVFDIVELLDNSIKNFIRSIDADLSIYKYVIDEFILSDYRNAFITLVTAKVSPKLAAIVNVPTDAAKRKIADNREVSNKMTKLFGNLCNKAIERYYGKNYVKYLHIFCEYSGFNNSIIIKCKFDLTLFENSISLVKRSLLDKLNSIFTESMRHLKMSANVVEPFDCDDTVFYITDLRRIFDDTLRLEYQGLVVVSVSIIKKQRYQFVYSFGGESIQFAVITDYTSSEIDDNKLSFVEVFRSFITSKYE